MSASPWMPIYWAEYFGDTMHLTTEEHGAYLLLIGAYWRRGRALPDDDVYLAGVTKMSKKRFLAARGTLAAFFDIEDMEWRHRRVEKEILKASARSATATANAKRRVVYARGRHNHTKTPKTQSPSTQPETPPLSATETTSPTQTSPPSGGNSKNGHDRGSRMPEDWRPSNEAVQFCRDNFPECTDAVLNKQFPLIKEWGLTATGPNSRKRNWDRYFINWMRRACNEIQEREARERRWAEQRSSKH